MRSGDGDAREGGGATAKQHGRYRVFAFGTRPEQNARRSCGRFSPLARGPRANSITSCAARSRRRRRRYIARTIPGRVDDDFLFPGFFFFFFYLFPGPREIAPEAARGAGVSTTSWPRIE